MLTPHEVLFRARKGRKNMAKAYLSTRKKHGPAAARALWKQVRELTKWHSDDPEILRANGELCPDEYWISRRNGVNCYGERE